MAMGSTPRADSHSSTAMRVSAGVSRTSARVSRRIARARAMRGHAIASRMRIAAATPMNGSDWRAASIGALPRRRRRVRLHRRGVGRLNDQRALLAAKLAPHAGRRQRLRRQRRDDEHPGRRSGK